MNQSSESAPPTKPSFLRSLRLVAWGFLGVRKNSEYQRDLAQVNPFHVILAGIIGVLVALRRRRELARRWPCAVDGGRGRRGGCGRRRRFGCAGDRRRLGWRGAGSCLAFGRGACLIAGWRGGLGGRCLGLGGVGR